MHTETNLENVLKKEGLIKIAIDMHLKNYRVVRQIDHSNPQPAQKFEPVAFYGWLEKQRALAARVVVCYEAGLLWVSAGAADGSDGGGSLCDRAAELG